MLGAARYAHRTYSRQLYLIEEVSLEVEHLRVVGSIGLVGDDEAVAGTLHACQHALALGNHGVGCFGANVIDRHCHKAVARSVFGGEDVDCLVVACHHAALVVEARHKHLVFRVLGFHVFHINGIAVAERLIEEDEALIVAHLDAVEVERIVEVLELDAVIALRCADAVIFHLVVLIFR